jgi:hypothetical protein
VVLNASTRLGGWLASWITRDPKASPEMNDAPVLTQAEVRKNAMPSGQEQKPVSLAEVLDDINAPAAQEAEPQQEQQRERKRGRHF